MTSSRSTARAYTFIAALLVLSVFASVIAAGAFPAQPKSTATDPRIAQLAAREQQLRRDTVRTRQIVQRRWAGYERALARRKRLIASRRREIEQLQREWAAADAAVAASAYASAASSGGFGGGGGAAAQAPVVRAVQLPASSPPVTTTHSS